MPTESLLSSLVETNPSMVVIFDYSPCSHMSISFYLIAYEHLSLDLSEGDEAGSFILKGRGSSGTQNHDKTKIAKYSIALQYLLLERIFEDQTG